MRGYLHLSPAGKSGIVSIAGCNGSLSCRFTAETCAARCLPSSHDRCAPFGTADSSICHALSSRDRCAYYLCRPLGEASQSSDGTFVARDARRPDETYGNVRCVCYCP